MLKVAMLAATFTQGGEFKVQDIPAPEAAAGELLLRVRAASICGTDLKIIRSGHRKLSDGQRIVLGHEFVGTIEAIGDGVDTFTMGQRVGVAPNAGCGRCEGCLRGEANYCPDFTAFGIDRDGAHASLVRIPARHILQGNVISIPEAVSNREASLLEPLSCAIGGIRAARIQMGDTVLIYGAGPMGLLLAMLCRASGAARLIMVDLVEQRLAQAKQLGADEVISPAQQSVVDRVRDITEGRGIDVAITACPVASVQAEAIGLLAPYGRLCLFGGLPKGSENVSMDTNAIHYKNLIVSGSTGGSVEDYQRGLNLVQSGQVDLLQIASDFISLEDLAYAYHVALEGAQGKVVLVEKDETEALSEAD
ncbi:alcohol dehydrogenase catalytic domain-containing protein [Pirellulales bacterium]|nr:alcohol dehydrogenase catalytic domain-containing protein [Pirellulales bacterium]